MSWTGDDAGGLGRVLGFVSELQRRNVSHQLASYRDDALMVVIAVPGERWEVEFLADGTVEVERFRSDGRIGGQEELSELWALCDE